MSRHECGGRKVSVSIGIAAGFWLALLNPAAGSGADGAVPSRSNPPAARGQRPELRNRVAVLKKGSSSKDSRQTGERLLSTVRMTREQRRGVNAVLKGTSYFRELPTLKFEIDPRAYFYLTEQPDVTVSIWRALGISKFRVRQTSPGVYDADAGDGTKGSIEVIQRSPQHQVILCRGVFKSSLLLKGVKTRSVIHMQTQFTRDKSGKTFVTHRAFTHVAFQSTAIDIAAKMLSPVGNLVLDQNFREISLFMHVMSLGMSRQPGWVERITRKMKGVSDKQKKDLLKVTAKVYFTARKKQTIPLFKTRQEYLRELMRPLATDGKPNRRPPESSNRVIRPTRDTGTAPAGAMD